MSEHSDFLEQDLVKEHRDEIKLLQAEIKAIKASNKELVEALEVLAKLGNGDIYGNSEGNLIAICALSKVKTDG